MRGLIEKVKAFHNDEQGAPEMSTVLIIALIVVPLVIGIVFFGRLIMGWFNTAGSQMKTEGNNAPKANTL